MSSLLEAVAALSISGAVMVLSITSLTAAARLHAACATLSSELFASRQLEQLVDRATLLAGNGPNLPEPVSALEPDTIVFASDHDGDGIVDTGSSESTALEVRQISGHVKVRVRLGRQTMTVFEADDSDAVVSALDAAGRVADAAGATFIELAITSRDESFHAAGSRRMLFSLPARTMQ